MLEVTNNMACNQTITAWKQKDLHILFILSQCPDLGCKFRVNLEGNSNLFVFKL